MRRYAVIVLMLALIASAGCSGEDEQAATATAGAAAQRFPDVVAVEVTAEGDAFGVTRVTVEGRDQANGYGGGRRAVPLPGS